MQGHIWNSLVSLLVHLTRINGIVSHYVVLMSTLCRPSYYNCDDLIWNTIAHTCIALVLPLFFFKRKFRYATLEQAHIYSIPSPASSAWHCSVRSLGCFVPSMNPLSQRNCRKTLALPSYLSRTFSTVMTLGNSCKTHSCWSNSFLFFPLMLIPFVAFQV